jgi:type VI secretion system protein ImpH
MGWSDYQRLLPGGRGLARFKSLVRNFIGDELMWEVNLVLRSDETPAAQVGCCGLLGQSAWLSPDEVEHDADDFVLSSQ